MANNKKPGLNIVTSIDLEMNNPTPDQKIIEIGVCIGSIQTGEIIETLSAYVKINEPLTPFINQLTGITDNDLETKGTSLLEAYEKLREMHNRHRSHKMPIQWGGGDIYKLKKDVFEAGLASQAWIFGYTSMNVNNIFQTYCLANDMSLQSGLKKSLSRLGMRFQGSAHTATDDAVNTFRIYLELMRRYKK